MANLLFKTRFQYTTIGDPVVAGAAVKFPVTGANEGYDWACTGLNAQSVYIQLINNSATVTPGNYLNFADKPAIIPVTNAELPGYYGNAVTLNLKDTGFIGNGANVGWGGQNMFVIQRIADGTNPLPPVMDDLYVTSTFKLSPDIWSGMVPGNAGKSDTTIFQFKTGGYIDPITGLVTYKGDQRIVVQATKNSSGLIEIKTHADQNANGPFSPSLPDLWETVSSAAPIDQSGYNKLEFFVHRHATAGICKVAVNDVIVCNLTNVCTKGTLGLDIGRIFIPMYTGANLGKGMSTYAKWRAFDGIPGGSILLTA